MIMLGHAFRKVVSTQIQHHSVISGVNVSDVANSNQIYSSL